MTDEQKYRQILSNHLPQGAVDWVYCFLNTNKVHLHITNHRRSKYGDYRCPQPRHLFHEISVNGDLSSEFFLWVFLHEAAHLNTFLRYRNRVAPHGHEWQAEYARLLLEQRKHFPESVSGMIEEFASGVPLSNSLQRKIEYLLQHPTDNPAEETAAPILDSLPEGTCFRLVTHPEHVFRSDVRRRTRWLCTEIQSGKKYTISGMAEVIVEQK